MSEVRSWWSIYLIIRAKVPPGSHTCELCTVRNVMCDLFMHAKTATCWSQNHKCGSVLLTLHLSLFSKKKKLKIHSFRRLVYTEGHSEVHVYAHTTWSLFVVKDLHYLCTLGIFLPKCCSKHPMENEITEQLVTFFLCSSFSCSSLFFSSSSNNCSSIT